MLPLRGKKQDKGQIAFGFLFFILFWLVLTMGFFALFDKIHDWLNKHGIWLWGFPKPEGGVVGWLKQVWHTLNPIDQIKYLFLKVFYSAIFALIPALIVGVIVMKMFGTVRVEVRR